MSAKAINWAWRQTGLTPVEKCVLMALADFYTDSSGCFPSVKSICEKANIKKTAAAVALNSLVAKGFVVKVNRRAKTNGKISNDYALIFNKTDAEQKPLNGHTHSRKTDIPHNRKTVIPPKPLNALPRPLNGHKLIEYNNTYPSDMSDPIAEFLKSVAPEPEILEDPPFDPVKFFWSEAIRKLRNMAVPDPKARKMVGKWLKQTGDDQARVMAAIDQAVEKGTMEPVGFIVRLLDNQKLPTYSSKKQEALNDTLEWLKVKSEERKSRRQSDDSRGSDRNDHGGVSKLKRSKPPEVRRTRHTGLRTLPAADAGKTGGPLEGDPVQSQVSAADSGIDF